MTVKSWIAALVGLWLTLVASSAAAVSITVTIDEIEINDDALDSAPAAGRLTQYRAIGGAMLLYV